ncbi:hypothetical protein D1007_03664 [Hordeum vulgare]|nr:hypothetical protein D1007_03664 [Hordeum vulgare]
MRLPDLHLPCFPRATSIDIEWPWHSNICFMQLRSGELSALERLSLKCGSVIDFDTLITRCPCLRVLSVFITRGSDIVISVHSVSLQTLEFKCNDAYTNSIDIVTPKLKQLELIFNTGKDFSVSISAPMVEKVVWIRQLPSGELTTLFGFWRLDWMAVLLADRFGDGDYCLELGISTALDEWYYELDLTHEVEFAQEMEKLPVIDFSVLELSLTTDGHVFGALLWRLLGFHQIRAATKRLEVVLYSFSESCREDCPCDEPKNWRCQSIPLTRLEEVHIKYFTGEEHEHDFLELIFRSSPMLNRVTLTLSHVFGGCTKKIYNTFSPYPDVKGYVYSSSGKLVPRPSD